MKDKKKIIVPLLLAGVATSGVVANINNQVQTSTYAETAVETTNLEGAGLSVGSFRKHDGTGLVSAETFSVGSRVYLPAHSELAEGEEIVYTVKKDKKTVKIEHDDILNADYFTAKFQGYYTVSIAVKSEGKITTEVTNLNVWVETTEATIKLPTNSEYVVPAKMPKEQDNFKIPAPSIVTVGEDGKDVTTTARDLDADVAVYLVTPTREVALTLAKPVADDASKDYYAVAKDDLKETGTYQIVYEYKQNSSVVTRLESNFQVVDNYDTSKIKLKMKFLSSMPSSGNVNTDISIPKVKVSDTNTSTDAINAYVKVIVKNVKTGEEVAVNYDDYTFRPTKEGYYSVTYVASIGLFGEEIKTGEVTPGDIIEVTDKQAPVVIPTYAYDMSEGEITKIYNGKNIVDSTDQGYIVSDRKEAEELLVNRRVDIPSVAVLKTVDGEKVAKVTIPAAYATDNFYTFKGADNDEIKITRTYRSSKGALSTVTTDANKPAEITFKSKGNSEIRYKATDKAGNTLGEIVYDIVIYDEDDDLSAGQTKISLNVGTTVVSDKDKTLTFVKPTATDTYDKNVDVRTFYKDGTEIKELTETNSDGKYEIKISDITSDEFEIYAEAYVDNALVGTRGTEADDQLATSNKVTSKVVKVKVLRTNNDTSAPVFTILGAEGTTFNNELFTVNQELIKSIDNSATAIDKDGYLLNGSEKIKINETTYKAGFDQGSETVKLPSVQFSEDLDTNLSISVKITDRKGNLVSKTTQERISYAKVGDKHVYTVSDATFKLSQYGIYTVTYTAKDFAGNITVKSYGIRVNDKTAPTITVVDEDKFNKTIEVGEYFEVPSVILSKDGNEIDGGSYKWEIVNKSNGAECIVSNNGFTPTSEGTFFIKYTATDGLGNDASLTDNMYSVTAKDTKAPKIELDLNNRFPATKEWAPAENEDFMIIDIPVAFATDENRGQVEVVYTVTGPNGTKPEVKDYDDRDDVKYFKATAQGTYTIKYSAVDEAGNESNITKTVAVGDCEAPTLTWTNQDKDLVKEAKLNQTYKLDLNDLINNNKLSLSDNKTTSQATLLEKMTVSLTGPDGTTITNLVSAGNGYEWKLTKTGQYTLKINVKDEVGNSNTYSYTINVPNEEADSNKVSPVLGTVLVVLSVVVLAGVVVYFVASSKKKTGKKSTTKKSK